MGDNASMKQRCFSHDYSQVATYLVTLVVNARKPLLGNVEGDVTVPYCSPNAPYTKFSELGNAIITQEIPKIQEHYPMVKVWKLCVMPDHIHLILRVSKILPEGVHLGTIINSFKSGCNARYWKMFNYNTPPRIGLFEPGYNDKVLYDGEQLS